VLMRGEPNVTVRLNTTVVADTIEFQESQVQNPTGPEISVPSSLAFLYNREIAPPLRSRRIFQ
jgi:hypothetical protein